MRLVAFGAGGPERVGLLVDGAGVVDLHPCDVGLPGTLTGIVAAWEEHLPALRAVAARRCGSAEASRPLVDVELLLPLRPRRVMATGTNYRDHVEEMSTHAPRDPSAFLKLPGCELGPGQPLRLRAADRHVDYEGEIAIVIGRHVRDADPARAVGAIAGLMLANDISRRDLPTTHIVLAKGGPGFCPLGPALVTTDELDLAAISFTVHVNGELRQSADTGALIHTFADIVVAYSRAIPLEPGDVILTGTPAGVGVGRRPPVFLDHGDLVVVSSPKLGTLRTPVVRAGDDVRSAGSAQPTPAEWGVARVRTPVMPRTR